jgi:hypothetical protein
MRLYAAHYTVMEGANDMARWPSAPAAAVMMKSCRWSACTATAAAAR